MADRNSSHRILVVGDASSLPGLGLSADELTRVDLVASLAKASAQPRLSDYAKVIIDPALLSRQSSDVCPTLPQRSDECAQAIFDNAAIGLAIVDLEQGKLLSCNLAFHQMLGYDPGELDSRSLLDITCPEEVEDSKMVMSDLISGKVTLRILEKRYIRKDGSVIWGRVTARLVLDAEGKPFYSIGTIEDITERKRDEEVLRKYRMLSENSRDIILFLRTDGRIIEANNAAISAYGYSRDELLSLSVPDIREAGTHDQAAPQMAEAYFKGVLFETIHRRKDGSTFPVEVNARGTEIGGEKTLLSIIRDITVRKQQEQELLSHERYITSILQQMLFPSSVPQGINGYNFGTAYRSNLKESNIGGDFYDIFELDGDRICVMIGDVAGKGLAAAIRVAEARYAIRSSAFVESEPSRVLEIANISLSRSADEDHNMLTAFLAVLDLQSGVLTYSNAGHESPVLLYPDGKTEELDLSGVPLGILSGSVYKQSTCRLDPGSRIVMFTDGITEARKSSTDLFSKEAVIEFVSGCVDTSVEDIASDLLNIATDYAEGQLQDDAAIVVIGRDRL